MTEQKIKKVINTVQDLLNLIGEYEEDVSDSYCCFCEQHAEKHPKTGQITHPIYHVNNCPFGNGVNLVIEFTDLLAQEILSNED